MTEEYAPMPELVEVGHGESGAGERWWLRVGWGSSDSFYTIIEVERPNGQREGGGSGDAPLRAGEMIRVGTGLSDAGPLRIVGRVDPAVRRVRIELDDPSEPDIELTPLGDPATYGMRFIATVLPREVGFTKIIAVDEDGGEFDAKTRLRSARDLDALWSRRGTSPPEG